MQRSSLSQSGCAPKPAVSLGARLAWLATTGACTVEYGLMIGLVSAACAAASAALGRSIAHGFSLVHFGQQIASMVGGS